MTPERAETQKQMNGLVELPDSPPNARNGSPLPLSDRASTQSSATADHRAFLHALDMVSDGLAFFDTEGMLLHTNRVLVQALRQPGTGEQLQQEILAFARSLGSTARSRMHASGEAIPAREPEGREIRTDLGTYRLRGSHLPGDPFGVAGSVLIALEPPLAQLPTDEELRQRFGLTRQESRVARLIGRGCSNAEVAAEIGISPHTVRRHTERLFFKLGVRSRAEVGQRLHSSGRPEAKDR